MSTIPEKPARPTFPVKVLKFSEAIDVPGTPTTTGLKGLGPDEKVTNRKCYRIFFDPAIRHHRVEYYEPSPNLERKPDVRFIHESKVSIWEPA